MKLSVPKGESPVSAGVVPGSQASGKVANCEVGTEVSQTAVSVLTNRNYIRRLLGRMRYHMLPKSKALERGQYRNSRCSSDRHKDVHLTEGGLELYGLQIEKSAEVIVVNRMSWYQKDNARILTVLMKD